jgi:hypothetical protein
MPDSKPNQRLIDLAEAVRDLPPGDATDLIRGA